MKCTAPSASARGGFAAVADASAVSAESMVAFIVAECSSSPRQDTIAHPDTLTAVARLSVPDGPGGEAAMIWTLRPQLAGMVERMIRGAYQQSVLPPDEREVARMRIAQLNDCVACSDFRAQSVREAGVSPDLYDNVQHYRDYPGYTTRQRLAIEYAERFATAHDEIDDAFFALLRQNFSDEEVLDLTLCLAVYLGLGRTLAVLGVDQSCDIEI